MIFDRQYFPPKYRVSLSRDAIEFDKCLLSKDWPAALNILRSNFELDPLYWERQKTRMVNLKKKLDSRTPGIRASLKVAFKGFWPLMDPNNCQLLDFIRSAAKDVSIYAADSVCDADIVIYSCYGSSLPCDDAQAECDRWLFLGENIRPSYYHYDFSLSFDSAERNSRNIYFPLWLLEIDWFKRLYRDRHPYSSSLLAEVRHIDYSSRLNAVAYIGNNAEPWRESSIAAIQDAGIEVHRYGSQSNPVGDKIDLLSKYKCTIAFENSFYPGYITEKPIHSFLAGTIGLYWGCPLRHGLMSSINPLFKFQDSAHYIVQDAKAAVRTNGTIVVPPLASKQYLTSEFGRICAGIRKRLVIYSD